MNTFWGVTFPVSIYVLIIAMGIYFTKDMTVQDFENRYSEYRDPHNLRKRILYSYHKNYTPTIVAYDSASQAIVKAMNYNLLNTTNTTQLLSADAIIISPFEYMKEDTYNGSRVHRFTEKAMALKQVINITSDRNSSRFLPIIAYGSALNFIINSVSRAPYLMSECTLIYAHKWETKPTLSYLMSEYNDTLDISNADSMECITVANFTRNTQLNEHFKVDSSYNGEHVSMIEHRYSPIFGFAFYDEQLIKFLLSLATIADNKTEQLEHIVKEKIYY